MNRFLFSVKSYILHLIKRKDEHSLHSPFLFDFYNKTVIQKSRYISARLETERIHLFSNEEEISLVDLGAKSRNPSTSRKIKTIARHSVLPAKQVAFLSAVIEYLQPKSIVELGTSFGLTTCYLAEHAKEASITTFEGNDPTAYLATDRFVRLGFGNIKLVLGHFDDTLGDFLGKNSEVDFIFFDGNHQYEPTMRYFGQCLEKTTETSVFAFHDIYWSGEMAKAWREICAHPTVMLSVDLYYLGLVFFRKNQPKQHFVIKF